MPNNQSDTGISPVKTIINNLNMKTSIPSPKSAPSVADIRGGATIPVPGPGGTEGNAPEPTPTEPVLTPPFEISGLYAVEAVLSKGGMGTTYLGRGLRNKGQEVVIKVPDTHSASTLRRFEKECLTLEQLEHENVVKCLGHGIFSHGGESYPYLAMVYVKGQTLRQRLEGGRMPWEEVKILLENMLKALGYIASKGICHRDIKPENIIYDAGSKKWVLVDFGIAKTSMAQVLKTLEANDGTWDYMSPEQKSGEQVDIRSDIYSLGKVAWEALLGIRPEAGTRLPHEAEVEGCTDDVDVLIRRMVEFSPKERYATPEEALEALESGAQRMDQDVRWRRYLRLAFKVACWCLGTLVLLGAIWLAGDFVCTAKLKQIAAEAKSPTVQLRKMKAAVGAYPLYWGRSYLESEEVDVIRKKADREYRRMLRETQELKVSMQRNDLKDEDKKRLCNNFLSAWKTTFYGTSEYQEVEKLFEGFFLVEELDDVKKMRDELVAVETYERCHALVLEASGRHSGYKSGAARVQMGELLREAKNKRIKLACDEVKSAIGRGNIDELYSVCARCRKRMKELDNVPQELSDVEKDLVRSINRLLHDKIDIALANNAYFLAVELLRNYKANLPDSDNNVKQQMMMLAERFADDINTHQDDYERCYKEAERFMEIFSDEDFKDSRVRVQRSMSSSIHKRVNQIVEEKGDSVDKKVELRDVGRRLEYVSFEHRRYFRDLLGEAEKYAENNKYAARRSYKYCWDQYLEARERRYAKIHIESIEVRMSEHRYWEMKGKYSCNPYVVVKRSNNRIWNRIWEKGDNEISDIRNKKTFTVTPNAKDALFFVDTKSDYIYVGLGDRDFFVNGPREIGVSWKIDLVRESGTYDKVTRKTADGTEFDVRYKFE